MARTKFVYVTIIRSTPGKIWRAITDPRVTRRYWMMENVSDWKRGSPWEHREPGRRGALRLVGTVLESKPPRRLVISWAFPKDAKKKSEYSRVAFEIAKLKRGLARLTVTHDDLHRGSAMEKGITWGWPRVLSSLKSFLETGRAFHPWLGT